MAFVIGFRCIIEIYKRIFLLKSIVDLFRVQRSQSNYKFNVHKAIIKPNYFGLGIKITDYAVNSK